MATRPSEAPRSRACRLRRDFNHLENLSVKNLCEVYHNPKCPFWYGYWSVNVSGRCYTSSIKKVEKGSQTRKESK